MPLGKWDKLQSFWMRNRNFYRNNIRFALTQKNKKYKLLEKNRELKGILKGKRCFIVGNGPSVKQQDLSLLKNEIVFTVNKAVSYSDFDKIYTNFHFWTDPNLFVVDEDSSIDMKIIEMMRGVRTKDNNPICFFPLKQKGFIEKYQLDQTLAVYYLAPELGWLYEKFDETFDLTKLIPQFGTVVQYCIAAAIYMEASEIYILGCDNTGIINTINSLLQENDGSNYGYHVSEDEKIRMERTAKRNGLEIDTIAYLNDIKAYRILNEYCVKRNIKLINCSARTVIDSLPRDNYEKVIREVK